MTRMKRSPFCPDVSPARLRRMAESMTTAQIADAVGLEPDDVEHILAGTKGGSQTWILRCARSGRSWRLRSQRAAYRQVCLLGLVDWDWHPELNA